MFILGFLLGVVVTAAVLFGLGSYYGSRETNAQHVERELQESRRAVDKIFGTTYVRMEAAAKDYHNDLPPTWRERLR